MGSLAKFRKRQTFPMLPFCSKSDLKNLAVSMFTWTHSRGLERGPEARGQGPGPPVSSQQSLWTDCLTVPGVTLGLERAEQVWCPVLGRVSSDPKDRLRPVQVELCSVPSRPVLGRRFP